MIILEFWFICFAFLFMVGGIFAAEIESFFVGSVLYLASLAALQLFFDIPVWQSIVDNPLFIVLYLTVYTVAGSIFTLLWMWPEYIRESSSKLNSCYVDFIKRYPEGTKEEFLDSSYYPFNVSDYKQTIATWILLWPFACAWELLSKPTKYIYNLVYDALGKSFETIGKKVANRALNK